ncbi:unnamed protein product [Gordionus sp. m RMFG-2023]
MPTNSFISSQISHSNPASGNIQLSLSALTGKKFPGSYENNLNNASNSKNLVHSLITAEDIIYTSNSGTCNSTQISGHKNDNDIHSNFINGGLKNIFANNNTSKFSNGVNYNEINGNVNEIVEYSTFSKSHFNPNSIFSGNNNTMNGREENRIKQAITKLSDDYVLRSNNLNTISNNTTNGNDINHNDNDFNVSINNNSNNFALFNRQENMSLRKTRLFNNYENVSCNPPNTYFNDSFPVENGRSFVNSSDITPSTFNNSSIDSSNTLFSTAHQNQNNFHEHHFQINNLNHNLSNNGYSSDPDDEIIHLTNANLEENNCHHLNGFSNVNNGSNHSNNYLANLMGLVGNSNVDGCVGNAHSMNFNHPNNNNTYMLNQRDLTHLFSTVNGFESERLNNSEVNSGSISQSINNITDSIVRNSNSNNSNSSNNGGVVGNKKKGVNMTECVPVPSSEHVAEIVGRQGCKIKALRAKTNTYIKTPVRGEEPVFVVTGRKEDVVLAKREIISAAEHFSQIRASRKNSAPILETTLGGLNGNLNGSINGSMGMNGARHSLTDNDLIGRIDSYNLSHNHDENEFNNNMINNTVVDSSHNVNNQQAHNTLHQLQLQLQSTLHNNSAHLHNNNTVTQGQNQNNMQQQITIRVRVPYKVVGLVVGPKGATIKRIQQTTHTYIVTPSRDREPVFEITGSAPNVHNARIQIENHIAVRTGNNNNPVGPNANNLDNSFMMAIPNNNNHLSSSPFTGNQRRNSSPAFYSNYLNNLGNNNVNVNDNDAILTAAALLSVLTNSNPNNNINTNLNNFNPTTPRNGINRDDERGVRAILNNLASALMIGTKNHNPGINGYNPLASPNRNNQNVGIKGRSSLNNINNINNGGNGKNITNNLNIASLSAALKNILSHGQTENETNDDYTTNQIEGDQENLLAKINRLLLTSNFNNNNNFVENNVSPHSIESTEVITNYQTNEPDDDILNFLEEDDQFRNTIISKSSALAPGNYNNKDRLFSARQNANLNLESVECAVTGAENEEDILHGNNKRQLNYNMAQLRLFQRQLANNGSNDCYTENSDVIEDDNSHNHNRLFDLGGRFANLFSAFNYTNNQMFDYSVNSTNSLLPTYDPIDNANMSSLLYSLANSNIIINYT